MDMDPHTPFVLNIWRKNHYMEVAADPPDNRFGVDMGDYVAK